MKKRIYLSLLLLAMLFCSLMFSACFGSKPEGCKHQYGSLVSATSATCTEDGAVAHYECSKCNKYFDESKKEISSIKIPATGHSPATAWTTENGKHYHACENDCGTRLDEANCSGGTATCTTLAECQHCQKEYGVLVAHNYTAPGYDEFLHWSECECGAKQSSNHNCAFVTTNPTCTTQGYTTYTCSCGYSYVDDYTLATGHTFNNQLSQNDSYHWYQATCEHSTEISGYEKHDFDSEIVTHATCTTQGYTTYTCECGYSYKGGYTDALGHSVNLVEKESVLFDNSSCTYAVTYGGECSRCQAPVIETKNVERHSFFEKITKTATCSTAGEKGTFCSVAECKHHTVSSQTTAYSDASAHNWEEQSVTRSVTTYKCRDCEATKQKAGTSANVSSDNITNLGEVEFDKATIGLDQGIKNNLGGKDVNITADTLGEQDRADLIASSNLSEIIGNKPIYDFTMSTNDGSTTTPVENLGGTATIRIPYELNGEDPNHVIVWFIEGSKLQAIEAVYSEDANGNGFVTFTTTHFSLYSVATADPELLCQEFGHDQTNILVVAPTCVAEGYTVCLRCGERVENSTVSALGHNWHGTVKNQATCSANGIIEYSCSDCEAKYQTIVPAMGHNYEQTAQTVATCKADGSVTFGCSHCQESYTVTTPQLAHAYVSVTVDPTCTQNGYTEKACGLCGDVVRSAIRPANGHSLDNIWHHDLNGHYHACTVCGEKGQNQAHVAGPEATEQSAQICTVCERVLKETLVHQHSLQKVEKLDPTCTTGGNVEYYTCECNKWFKDEKATQLITDHTLVFLPANGHDIETVVAKQANCTENGYTEGLFCKTCKIYLRGHIELDAIGHDYVIKNQTAPTCTEQGTINYACRHCGDQSKASDTTAKLEHNYLSVVTAPTCTEKGFTTHICTRCSDKKVDGEKTELGHLWSEGFNADQNEHWKSCVRCQAKDTAITHTPNYKEATTEHGVNCVKCGYVIAEAIEHTHVARPVAVKDATCETSGNISYYTCTCGEWFYDEACENVIHNRASVILPSKGHELEFHKKVDATCSAVGYTAGYYCIGCQQWLSGRQEIEIIDHVYQTPGFDENSHWLQCNTCSSEINRSNHSYKSQVTAPTCTESGYTTYTCECGYAHKADQTEVLGHNWGEPKSNYNGRHTLTCLNDSEHTQIVNCVYESNVVAPTCLEQGYTLSACECGHSYKENYVQVVAHSFENYVCKWCGLQDPDKPVEEQPSYKVAYTYGYEAESDGEKMKVEGFFYANGEFYAEMSLYNSKTGEYEVKDTQSGYWVQKDGILTCYQDKELTKINGRFIINQDGSLTLDDTPGNDGPSVDVPTDSLQYHYYMAGEGPDGQKMHAEFLFLNGGVLEYKQYIVMEDGSSELDNEQSGKWVEKDGKVVAYLDSLTFNFVVIENNELVLEQGEGNTPTTPTEPEDFDDRRNQALEQMRARWEGLEGDVNVTINDEHKASYKEIYSNLRKATTDQELATIWEDFERLVNQIVGSEEEMPVYSYSEIMTDSTGLEIMGEILFMSNGRAIGNEYHRNEKGEFVLEETHYAFWMLDGNLIKLFEDAELTERIGTLIIDENGNLSYYKCTEHEYVTDYKAPTCTEEGYEGSKCINCGSGNVRIIHALGHSFVEGKCERCEAIEGDDSEFESMRAEALKQMNTEWNSLYEEGFDINDEQVAKYDDIYSLVKNANTVEEIQRYYMSFASLILDIRNNQGELVDQVTSETLLGGEISMTVGSDLNTFIKDNVVGRALVVTASVSGEHQFIVSEEMIEILQEGAEIGEHVYLEIHYENEQVNGVYHLYIYIIPNMNGATLVGSYNGNCIYADVEGMTVTIELYDNGYAKMVAEMTFEGKVESMTEYMTYGVNENVLSIYLDGVQMLFVINEESKKLENYQPQGETIGTYVFNNEYLNVTYVVYGEYAGAGEYIALATLSNTAINTTLAVYVYLDKEACLFKSMIIGDNSFNFDEKGNIYCNHRYVTNNQAPDCWNSGYIENRCSICGESQREILSPLGHEYDENGNCIRCGESSNVGEFEDFSKYHQEVKNNMYNEWNYVVENYNVQEHHIQKFDSLIEELSNAQTIDEINNVNDAFQELIEDVRNNYDRNEVYVESLEIEGLPESYIEGNDIEEFISNQIVGAKILLTMSDETSQIIDITREMVNYHGNEDNRVQLSIYYEHEYGCSEHTFSIPIIVDVSSATLLGTYSADVLAIMEAGSGATCQVELYDNGYAMLYLAFENERATKQIKYNSSDDGKIELLIEGALVVFSKNDEKKTLDNYQPQGELIGNYIYDMMGMVNFNFAVYGEYTGNREYMSIMNVSATNPETNENISVALTVYVALDIENKTFSCNVLEMTLNIGENGNIYCDHEYIVSGDYPNCEEGGTVNLRCEKCFLPSTQVVDPSEHQFNEYGVCEKCHQASVVENPTIPDTDVDSYRDKIKSEMATEYNNLTSKFDVQTEYDEQMNKILDKLCEAQTIEEIDYIFNSLFKELVNDIESGVVNENNGSELTDDNSEYNVA